MGCCTSKDAAGRGKRQRVSSAPQDPQDAAREREERAQAAEARAQQAANRGTGRGTGGGKGVGRTVGGGGPGGAPQQVGHGEKGEGPGSSSSSSQGPEEVNRALLASAAEERLKGANKGISAVTADQMQERRQRDELVGQIRELCARLGEEPQFGTNASPIPVLVKYKQHLQAKLASRRPAGE